MTQKHPTARVEQENTPNLSDFSPASFADWKKAAIQGLKGESYKKRLQRTTLDGISLEPIYTSEGRVKWSTAVDALVRGNGEHGEWRIGQVYQCASPEQFYSQMTSDLPKGITETRLVLDAARAMGVDVSPYIDALDVGLQINSVAELETALPSQAMHQPVHIQCYSGGIAALALLAAYCKKQNLPFSQINGSLGYSPLGQLSLVGRLPCSSATAFDEAVVLINWLKANAANMRALQIDGGIYHHGGAGAALEIACCVGEAATYLRELISRGIAADEVVHHLSFQLSTGGDFFEDIAKQRALRLLIGGLATAFGASMPEFVPIRTRTSRLFLSKDEPLTNVLRSITATLSGALGGAQSIHAAPFDEIFQNVGEFSQRVARNSQVVLQQECHIGEVIDPCGGSYFVERLTDELAAAAWKQFQQIDDAGGFVSALREGLIQRTVDAGYRKQQTALFKRKLKMIGVNDFVAQDEADGALVEQTNDKETVEAIAAVNNISAPIHSTPSVALQTAVPVQQMSLDHGVAVVDEAIAAMLQGATFSAIYCAVKGNGETIVAPVVQHRLASSYERLRQRLKKINSQLAAPCAVCLLRVGTVQEYKARVDFSSSFFRAVGFAIFESSECLTVAEAVDAAISANAQVTVICSSDENYALMAKAIATEMKRVSTTQLVVAGRVGDFEEEYKASGIDHFIYLGVNHFELLKRCVDGIHSKVGSHFIHAEKPDRTL